MVASIASCSCPCRWLAVSGARLASSEELRVPQQYDTIHSAIDKAAEADTGLVSKRRYRERIRLGPGIALHSTGDPRRAHAPRHRETARRNQGGLIVRRQSVATLDFRSVDPIVLRTFEALAEPKTVPVDSYCEAPCYSIAGLTQAASTSNLRNAMTDRQHSPRIQTIHKRLQPLRTALLDHPIYGELDSLERLHVFMQHHVFAVWDFMSLLTSLRAMVCSTGTPWLPPRDTALARFVNEIVLAEETDEDGTGGFASHFELYRRAMLRCGSDTSGIDELTAELAGGKPIHDALGAIELPVSVQSFVRQTFEVIESGDICAVAASFTFGREDLLPDVFQRVVDEIRLQGAPGLSDFQYYLARHIELDGDQHGPMAERLITSLCEEDENRWQRAGEAAEGALRARLDLWDGMLESIRCSEATLST